MKKSKMPLYYGDNGTYKFWKSTNSQVLINNHYTKENIWWCYIDGKFVVGLHAKTVEAILKKLRKHFNLDCVLDYSHKWEKPKSGKGNMVLLRVK